MYFLLVKSKCHKNLLMELCFPQDEAKEASPSNIDFNRLRRAKVFTTIPIIFPMHRNKPEQVWLE